MICSYSNKSTPITMSKPIFCYNKELNSISITHPNGKEYLFDQDDHCKILNHDKYFFFHDNDTDYPSFIYNDKNINYLEFLYKDGNIKNYKFINNNPYDLRRQNVDIVHPMNTYVHKKYDVIEFIEGHYPKNKHSTIMKNPLWRIKHNGKECLLMYCEPDTFFFLCNESYQKILDFEKTINQGKKLTFYKCSNGYVQTHILGGTLLYAHQIIMNHYGNGQGTKTTSIDHKDRNPLNNTMENLRVATRKEQEQNSTGIAPGTKRERQQGARDLPNGIDQSMLRKYVVYYLNTYNKEKNKTREYFRVEHPSLNTPWESSKSEKVPIQEKLNLANRVAEDLEKGIMPEKQEKILPKHISITKRSDGKSCLTFDKRGSKRYNLKMVLDESENIEDEINKLKQKIEEKYPDIKFDD